MIQELLIQITGHDLWRWMGTSWLVEGSRNATLSKKLDKYRKFWNVYKNTDQERDETSVIEWLPQPLWM